MMGVVRGLVRGCTCVCGERIVCGERVGGL